MIAPRIWHVRVATVQSPPVTLIASAMRADTPPRKMHPGLGQTDKQQAAGQLIEYRQVAHGWA